MAKILVLYYSKNGRTKKLAEKIALGAQKGGADVLIRTVPNLTTEVTDKHQPAVPTAGDIYVTKKELADCDGLAIGSPTHFGNMAAPLKYFIDSLTDVWLKGSLVNKPACVFTSSGSMHGGQESTLLSMMLPLFHHGMCIQGLPYSEPELHTTVTGCSPYGVSSVDNTSNRNQSELSDDEIVLSVAMGRRLASNALKLSK